MPRISAADLKRIHWVNAPFMILTPIAAAITVPIYISRHGLSIGLIAFFLVAFAVNNLSITCGYHRYFSHRSYQTHPLLRAIFVFLGAGAFQGSVVEWVTDHRRHHRKVDSEEDPYSIKKGFWYAHIGWLMFRHDDRYRDGIAPDLQKEPLVIWQHRFYPGIATAMGFGFPTLLGWLLGFGWGGLIFGGFLRVVLTHHSTFFVNSLCHFVGQQPYGDTHSARDHWFVAILTFGEGYHNFHHEFQADYRSGIYWYQWDPSKWLIRSLSFVGLASRLRRAANADVLRARSKIRERRGLIASGSTEAVNS